MLPKNRLIKNHEFKMLVWDYTLSPEVFFAILTGKQTLGSFTQEWAIARVLENINYYRALEIVDINTLSEKWTAIKKWIHIPAIVQGYEYVLRKNTLPVAR